MNIKQLSICLLLLMTALPVLAQQPIIIDHTCTDISAVPMAWIDQAQANYRMWYGHTSHGSQITTGIYNLSQLYPDYNYNATGDDGALKYRETSPDLGHPYEYNPGPPAWVTATINHLNNSANDTNIVMWSWCGGASDDWGPSGMQPYFDQMLALETAYPSVTFIYMTGHLDGSGTTGDLHQNNEEIRAFCAANNKILFDFADIERYDPDGVDYLALFATDGCEYDTNGDENPWGDGNWAQEWCNANPDSELCLCSDCDCAHSEPLNCNRKGRAFWWMMARIAGWNPAGSTPTPTQTPMPTDTPFATATSTPMPGVLRGIIPFERPQATPPHESYAVPITVTLCTGSLVAYTFETTTDNSGEFSISVPPGTFDVLVKNDHSLAQLVLNVTIPENGSTDLIHFDPPPEGDADNDNSVLSTDFFILRNTYNKQCGDDGYDGRADFDENCMVLSSDFVLLRAHYNESGSTCGTP